MHRYLFSFVLLLSLAPRILAGNPSDPYGSIDDLKLLKPEDRVDQPTVPAPAEAVILFDGKSLDSWTAKNGKDPAKWKMVAGGAMQVSGGDIVTRQKFAGKFKLHLEFRVPYMPKASGQGRGNSGVYLQGRYEIQILDSYGLKSKNNDCGGIYGVAAPLENACKAPTVWQTYDIEFTAPKFQDGKKIAPAEITAYHNGVKIHDRVKINVNLTTSGLASDPATPGPILLQDHGNPVQYRNIWLVEQKD